MDREAARRMRKYRARKALKIALDRCRNTGVDIRTTVDEFLDAGAAERNADRRYGDAPAQLPGELPRLSRPRAIAPQPEGVQP